MYECELDLNEKEDELASKLQFKKKKKKHKNNEVDEELAKEQEKLFKDAEELYLQSQASEMLLNANLSPMANLSSASRSLSVPPNLPTNLEGTPKIGITSPPPISQPQPGVMLELEKKLSAKVDAVESTDFDALGTKS